VISIRFRISCQAPRRAKRFHHRARHWRTGGSRHPAAASGRRRDARPTLERSTTRPGRPAPRQPGRSRPVTSKAAGAMGLQVTTLVPSTWRLSARAEYGAAVKEARVCHRAACHHIKAVVLTMERKRNANHAYWPYVVSKLVPEIRQSGKVHLQARKGERKSELTPESIPSAQKFGITLASVAWSKQNDVRRLP